jgi:hypothetical protein
MMESSIKLPDDKFNQDNIVKLDNDLNYFRK